MFDRPIGMNQGIQHPLAEHWRHLEAAYNIAMQAAWLYDNDRPCGAEANAIVLEETVLDRLIAQYQTGFITLGLG